MVSKHLYVLTGFGMGVRVPHVFVHAHIYLQYSFVVFFVPQCSWGCGWLLCVIMQHWFLKLPNKTGHSRAISQCKPQHANTKFICFASSGKTSGHTTIALVQ